jgi:hypothetical protein
LEEKKFKVDILGKKIDIVKSRVDIIHKKILVFLGVGAGTWIVGIKFIESNNFLQNIF